MIKKLFIVVFAVIGIGSQIVVAMHHGGGEKPHDSMQEHSPVKMCDQKTGEGIEIKAGWSPAVPPAVSVRAGYFTLVNHSNETLTITAAKSPLFAKVELHITEIDDGLAQMQAMDSVDVAAKSTIHFKPEGMHVMLMEPISAEIPKVIPMILIADNGERFSVMLHVKEKKMHAHNHHHHH